MHAFIFWEICHRNISNNGLSSTYVQLCIIMANENVSALDK